MFLKAPELFDKLKWENSMLHDLSAECPDVHFMLVDHSSCQASKQSAFGKSSDALSDQGGSESTVPNYQKLGT